VTERAVRRSCRVALIAGTVLMLGVTLGRSAGESAAETARLKKLDAGPRTIDISRYPADQKAGYAMFAKKCVKCHSLARAINTNFVLPADWERYIKRMVYKPDSKMSEADGKVIYRFLAYDSSVRKADSLRVHLSRLSGEDRTAAVTRIKALNPAFEPASR
jgi:hypothetical protein